MFTTQSKCALALISVLSVAPLSQAYADISANIGVTSNYIWRGQTQTSDNPAISGGVDYEHDSGFSAGVWVSNVEFGNDSGNETDFYGAYSGQVGDLNYSIGAIHYMYSEHDDSDFTEATFDFSYQAFSFGAAYLLDSDTDAEGDLYYYIGAATELSQGFSAGVTLGIIDPDKGDTGNYIQFDLSKEDFVLSVVRASDELDSKEDTKVLVSWSKSF